MWILRRCAVFSLVLSASRTEKRLYPAWARSGCLRVMASMFLRHLRNLGLFTRLLEALLSEIGFYIFTFPMALVAFSNAL